MWIQCGRQDQIGHMVPLRTDAYRFMLIHLKYCFRNSHCLKCCVRVSVPVCVHTSEGCCLQVMVYMSGGQFSRQLSLPCLPSCLTESLVCGCVIYTSQYVRFSVSCLYLPSCCRQIVTSDIHATLFYLHVRSGGLNLGPHAYMVSSLHMSLIAQKLVS